MLFHQEALLDVINVLFALLKDTGMLTGEPATTPTAASSHTAQPRATKTRQMARRLSRRERTLSVWFAVSIVVRLSHPRSH